MKKKEIKKLIKKVESKKRYHHSLRVAQMAKRIAKAHNINPKPCVKAALLHDIGYFLMEGKEGKGKGHGFVGADYLRDELKIKNKQIYKAVKYHTITHPKMDEVAKVVYLADKLEEGRSYPQREGILEIALEDLDQGMIASLENSLSYLREKGIKPHPNTEKTLRTLQGGSLKILDELVDFIDNKHGKDVELLDLRGKSADFDAMIVVTALNNPHMVGLSSHIQGFCEEKGYPLLRKDGQQSSGWIVLDFGDFLVHLFNQDQREFYKLERLWKKSES